jgi:single-strand DNA-binding protein
MVSFNKVILLGNLTKDPELKYNPSGKAVTTFSIGVNEYRKQGEESKVDYFDIVVWEKPAESCASYLKKGSGVLVEGRLRQRRWEQDGHKRSKVEIVASSVQFMPKRQTGDAEDGGDIPF